MRSSKPQQCSLCNRIFLTPLDLISHLNTFHSNHHFSTFSSSAAAAPAPTTFRHYPKLNRNPNHAFPARNRFDLNYYRSGFIDEQGRFHKGFPAVNPARKSNFMFGQEEEPKLMDLFPAMSSDGVRTLPLLHQLEQRRPQDAVTLKGGAISSSIDLTLRL
ncbi:hypothetical protein EUTSA_v10009393mg [Eutrema salsugineum]|uniref:C2H2-type domain-containing protein n=1 Tax=Eutrema salsugineum TaxID=72664 RepID=V4KFG1_EUTSA|nr:uncharacterized protein LOC18994422 [Eutrema salsugineum]ESQ36480.1 hypothetical protein EUTSA_v10009393mg [Eutrema salsugineum]